MSSTKHSLTKHDLAHFTGSATFYQHSLMRSLVYTEGVQYVAERGGAFWLIDLIMSVQHEPKLKAEEFQVWKLRKNGTGGATATCTAEADVLYTQEIPFTDFPLDEIELWAIHDGTRRTILLPSEY